MKADIFEDLFVLEMANNHLGNLDRGLAIIDKFSKIVRFNGVLAPIKIQLRDVNTLIHENYRHREDIRYIKKTLQTAMPQENYATLVNAVRSSGARTCATPFDEASVDMCVNLGVQYIKLASSDLNDWFLIEKIAKTRKPVIASTGGSTLKDIDDLVTFFENRNIPLAINHCVSLYPTEDSELEMNQIDFLKNRYPDVTIGFSSHEYHSWDASMYMAYAKGARTFERHIDIDDDGIKVSPYCSTPAQVDTWFKAFRKAKEMCGGGAQTKRVPPVAEIKYLDALVRGVFAKRDLPAGTKLTDDDVHLQIPLLKGQISCRELMRGEVLLRPVAKGAPLNIDDIDSPYSSSDELKKTIYARGLDPQGTEDPAAKGSKGIDQSNKSSMPPSGTA